MKRIISWLLATAMFFTVLMMPENAYADNLIIALSDRTVNVGEKVTVTIRMPAGVAGTVNLTYSQDVFTYSSASAEVTENAGTVCITLGDYSTENGRASGTVTFEAKASGIGSFAADAPNATSQAGDRVSLEGASTTVTVSGTAAAQPAENTVEEAAAAEDDAAEGDDSSDEETVADTAEQCFNIDSVNLYPSTTLPEEEIPDGFTQGTITLWGQEYPCIYSDEIGSDLVLVYLADKNGNYGAWYMVPSDSAEYVYPFSCIRYEDYLYAMGNSGAGSVEGASQAEQALAAQVADLQSQNKMLFWGFVIVVIFLLIVITVLVVKSRRNGDEDEEELDEPEEDNEDADEKTPIIPARKRADIFKKPDETSEPEENAESAEASETYGNLDTSEDPYTGIFEDEKAGVTEPEAEDDKALENVIAEAIIAQAKAATGKINIEDIETPEVTEEPEEAEEPAAEPEEAEEQEPEPASEEAPEKAEEPETEEEYVEAPAEPAAADTEPDSDDDDDDLIFLDI
jgi:hypothetical protein